VVVLSVMAIGSGGVPNQHAADIPPVICALRDWRLVARVVQRRDAAWDFEQRLGLSKSQTRWPERWTFSCEYLGFVKKRWAEKARKTYSLWKDVQRPEGAIRFVFGEDWKEAWSVAGCESGSSRTPRARNGQYLGMFQMGEYARSRFGHGETPLEQARAAHAYFLASGSDWSPWSCKP
jgi:hypothetical protein